MPQNPRIGSPEYFERLFQVEEKHWWARGMRAVAAGMLDAYYLGSKGLRVLDAGCGTGLTLTWLDRYHPAQTVGIDLSWHALQFCHIRGKRMLSQASVLELPFSNDYFGLIVCNDVLQHLPGKGADHKALEELYRVLKPGGHLLIRTNSSQSSREKPSNNEHHRLYSRDELRSRIERAGFLVSKATYANVLPALLPTLKQYFKPRGAHQPHQDSGLAIRLLPAGLEWLNTLLYWLLKGEAWYFSKPSRTSGFGHTIFFLVQKPSQ